MAIAFLLANTFLVLLGTYLRFRQEGLAYAGPLTLSERAWQLVLVVVAVLAILSAFLGRKRLPAGWLRPAAELLIVPLIFGGGLVRSAGQTIGIALG